MYWTAWVAIVILTLDALGMVATVGKPRPPISPANAVGGVILGTVTIICVIVAAAR